MTSVRYGSLPFEAQIAFFRKKMAIPSRTWTDLWQNEHDHAFVVAGAMRMALVEDLQKSVQKAIEQGSTLAEFRKDFDRIVAEHGWSYRGSRGWRTRVIYETNLRTSYQAGRYAQLQRFDYWQYHHSPASEDPRPEHLGWDGLVLAKDDPFWQTHYPPNGWGCKCTVTGISKKRLRSKGLKVSESPKLRMRKVIAGRFGPSPRTVYVPQGIDPGWAYAPGRDAWMRQFAIPPRGKAPWPFVRGNAQARLIPDRAAHDLLPEPKAFPASSILPAMKKGQEEDYARSFLRVFGADIGRSVVFEDVTGEPLVISEDLFLDATGRWKIGKRGRERYLTMLAQALQDPDEIWVATSWHGKLRKATLIRTYIARFEANGKEWVAIAVFDRQAGWKGITIHLSGQAGEMNDKVAKNRRGVRIYRRPS